MQDEYCPMDTSDKKCAVVSSDLINALGVSIPRPLSFADVAKLVNMSDTILYNDGNTMRGRRRTFAVDVSNSGSWIRFNVKDDGDIQQLINFLNCK